MALAPLMLEDIARQVKCTPKDWEYFFEIYCRENIVRYLLRYEDDVAVNVLKDLVFFKEMLLWSELHEYPDVVMRYAKQGLLTAHHPLKGDKGEGSSPDLDALLAKAPIRFYNLPSYVRRKVKELGYKDIDKFIAVEGVVKSVSQPIPMTSKAVFVCKNCGRTVEVEAYGRYIQKPEKCEYCGKKRTFVRDLRKSEMTNFQKIEIQDLPENLDAGEQPSTLTVYLTDDLVGKVRAGDKVILNGILRANIKDDRRADFNVFFQVNSVEFLKGDIRTIKISKQDEEKIKELARRSDIYDLLVKSLAPSVCGHEEIKLACILALVGGVPRQRKDGTRARGDIHVLIVGDPSVAKSQILRALKEIAPRAILTTGYSSSGAGLTVTVVRDEDGKWTIEAGALVLADKGVALIDEIEKMKKEDRKYILEALEQQTISISKAGINATLNSRCSVIAVANPKRGRFNRFEPLPDQIDLEPPLLSRFDLIFVLLDEPDERKDDLVAEHILFVADEVEPPIPKDLLMKYIAYVKQNVKEVKISKEAGEKLKEFYVNLRSMYKEEQRVAITVRQLEGLVRLAQASAKLQLRDVVTVEDAERAIRLFRKCLEQIAIDPETGKIDIDYAFTGTSATQRDRIAIIKRIIEELEDMTAKGAPEDEVFAEAERRGISRAKAEEIIQKLKQSGEIFSPRYGYYKVVKESS